MSKLDKKGIKMKDIDYVVDFTSLLGRSMLECGAEVERVNETIDNICRAYNLSDISVYSTSAYIFVSARNGMDSPSIRQTNIAVSTIHLARLKKLDRLVKCILEKKPDPSELKDKLYEAMFVPSYPASVVLIGYLIAMSSLCVIFGGGLFEVLSVCINTALIYFMSNHFNKHQFNHILIDFVCMFIVASVTIFLIILGLNIDFYIVMITNAFFLIPGIPMVNAVRNLLCGNEMNGLVELFKVGLEVAAIVAGLYCSLCIFGRFYN
ncbi:MAG: threonine/serine exporter family protein [Lachnospiraceae bacterium]|nr:threonine/serine exporter family protein [Lachnospiraceae bacterium]